jgi:hypothetical protein
LADVPWVDEIFFLEGRLVVCAPADAQEAAVEVAAAADADEVELFPALVRRLNFVPDEDAADADKLFAALDNIIEEPRGFSVEQPFLLLLILRRPDEAMGIIRFTGLS